MHVVKIREHNILNFLVFSVRSIYELKQCLYILLISARRTNTITNILCFSLWTQRSLTSFLHMNYWSVHDFSVSPSFDQQCSLSTSFFYMNYRNVHESSYFLFLNQQCSLSISFLYINYRSVTESSYFLFMNQQCSKSTNFIELCLEFSLLRS